MHEPWQLVTILPALIPGELQIWRITLPDIQTDTDTYTTTFTPEEVARAARIRVGASRLQFVIARAALRVLLGNALLLDPSKVIIEADAYGKPAITNHTVHFNLAHSGDTVLIALTCDCEVGIDVEHISREVEALDIARSAFSAGERCELESIADPLQLQRAFFQCWTRKEAIIKADGRGLSLPLAGFDVPVLAPASAISVKVPGTTANFSMTSTFYLSDLPGSDDLAAAFAVSSPISRLLQFDFPIGILNRFRG